ncbi:putative membrane CBS domain-containing protein [Clostridium baratii]|uniref:Transporter associated domain protein n=1 Tax=Clostridium baratii str. Sullivan TaxID=1415775 RepID=A0A0A7G1M2_9CLOT|nr:hemolysin family protein [Clostridium baratii]AIY84866.1 transporter associated domain protein [Clostridium baratii str. Sullivan]MDU1055006.1 hemolysin family protein [Clostridium baratii]CUP77412.1 putative membrane CBS domain-containing protein [Clostridium baratii]
MDSSYTGQIILLVILLVLSGFFSMSETALMSLSKIRIRHMVEEGVKGSKLVEKLIEDPNRLLGAILIGNNIVNIGASAIATSLAVKIFNGSESAVAVATAIMTVLVLIFGEITPKSIAKQKSEQVALKVSKPVQFCVAVFKPFVAMFTAISSVFIRLFGGDPKATEPFITEEELKTMVGVSEEEGVLEDVEKEMIFNVFDFADLQVKDVMVQRVDVTAIDVNDGYEDILKVIQEDQFSRIPVYDDTIDDIVGVLNVKDLIIADKRDCKFKVTDYMREPLYTFEFKKITELFNEMKKSRNHMAVVLDEYGGTVGIVTIEDVVEEIVGDIEDEYDKEREMIEVIKEDEYIVEGSARLDDISDLIGVNMESEEFDSVGGLVIGELGRIPEAQEEVTIGKIRFVVEEVEKNRIMKVRIYT